MIEGGDSARTRDEEIEVSGAVDVGAAASEGDKGVGVTPREEDTGDGSTVETTAGSNDSIGGDGGELVTRV